jgi:hypothetical protein
MLQAKHLVRAFAAAFLPLCTLSIAQPAQAELFVILIRRPIPIPPIPPIYGISLYQTGGPLQTITAISGTPTTPGATPWSFSDEPNMSPADPHAPLFMLTGDPGSPSDSVAPGQSLALGLDIDSRGNGPLTFDYNWLDSADNQIGGTESVATSIDVPEPSEASSILLGSIALGLLIFRRKTTLANAIEPDAIRTL